MLQHPLTTQSSSWFQPDTAERIAVQWETGPVVLRNAVRDPIFGASHFMEGVAYASREYLKRQTPLPWRVFVDRQSANADQLRRLASQGNPEPFEDYVRRLNTEFPKQDVSIILDKCEKGIPHLRQLLTPLLHDLFAIVGYPARPNHACLYAGRYHTTATGIHKDPCHVLMFCGIGRKRMAFWPDDYFAPNETLNDHITHSDTSRYLRDATILEITPHDILYWPADYWHVSVNESDDFNAAVSLGLYHRGSSAEHFLSTDFLKPSPHVSWVRDYPNLDIHGIRVEGKGRLSPSDLAQTDFRNVFDHWNRVLEILSKPGEAEFHVLKMALELITSAGFGRLPQAPLMYPPDLAEAVVSCEVPQGLITGASKRGVLVGANGSVSFHAGNTEAIDVVLEQLRTGDQVSLDSLLASATSDEQECIRAVLREAIAAGAIRVVAT